MESAARDASFNAIIDEYLRSHPNQFRKNEDEAPNIFGHEPKNIREIINGYTEEEERPDKNHEQNAQTSTEVAQNKAMRNNQEEQLMEGI